MLLLLFGTASRCLGQDDQAQLVLVTFDCGLLAAKGRKATEWSTQGAEQRPGGSDEVLGEDSWEDPPPRESKGGSPRVAVGQHSIL